MGNEAEAGGSKNLRGKASEERVTNGGKVGNRPLAIVDETVIEAPGPSIR